MAGIMTENLSDDIRKLDELRRKIDEVKKSLKGINIKVDLDIAEGLQAQLKSLTTEYNALLTTVAQGEAKMLATVNRIRESTQKVIDAQNAVIGANPSAPTTPTGTTTTAPTGTQNVGQQVQGAQAVEQANVQLAKSYQELERELDAIGGSMEANALLYVQETNAVNIAKENLKELNKQIKVQGYETEKQTRLKAHYTLQLEEHKKAMAQARIELGNQIKLNQAAGGSMAEMSQQLSRMRIVYRNLTETERNSDFGKGLLASIQMTDAEIKKLDATIGNHQRNVGNYASGWNGLNVSIQQMVRELPSLSMGFNTFFLAISNNLPIFVDELKRASAEVKKMKAAGDQPTPVWKQLLGGIFSWQTALIVGITLLAQYGDKIIDWVKGLFNGGEAAKKAAEEQKKLNEAIKDFSKEWTTEAGKLRASYERLRLEWLALSTEQEKRKWIKDNATEIGNLGVAFDNLAEAEDFFEKNTKNVIRAFELRAQAAAAAVQMQKAWERYYAEFDAAGQKKYADARTMIGDTIYMGDMVKYGLAEARRNERGGIEYYSTTTGKKLKHGGRAITSEMADAINRYRNEQLVVEIGEERAAAAERLRKASDKWSNIALSAETESAQLLKKYEPKKGGKGGKGGGQKWDAKAAAYEQAQIMRQYTESVIAIYQEAQLNITERRIAAMSEGTDREIAEIRNGAALELAAIEEQIKQLAKARAEREKNVWLKGAKGRTEAQYAETEAGKRTEADWVKIVESENPHIIAAFNTQKTLIKRERDKQIKEIGLAELVSEQETLREWAKHFGTREQQRQAIWEEWQAKIAKAKTEAQKKLLRSQMEAELNAFDFETFKKNINWEEAFSNLEAKSKEALTTLRTQLSQYIALNKDLKPDQIKAVTDALKQLDGAIANKSSIKDVIGLFKGGFKGKDGNILTGGYMDDAQAAGVQAVAGKFRNASEAIKSTIELTDTLGIEIGKDLREGLEETTEGMDKFSQGLQTFITNPIAGTMQVIDGLITSFRGMAKTIVGVFGIETANSRYDDLVEQYEGLLKLWDDLIGKKKEYITESYGAEINRAAKEAEQIAKNMADANRELGKAYLETKDFFLGRNKGNKQLGDMEDAWIEAAASAAGMEKFSFAGLFDLTGEQLQRVKENARQFWASMDDQTTEYLEAIISAEEELKNIHKAELEQMTGTTFDSVFEDFKGLLGNMTNSWQQFSDTASQYFQQAVIGNLVGEKFRAELEQWYEAFGASGTDGSFTQAERDSLLSQYDAIAERAIAERKRLAEMFGWSATESSESGTSGRGFAEMNQESADELNGRFASLQISNQGILNEAVQHTQALWATAAWSEEIAKHQQNMYSVADETRTILANSYLELKGISENTRKGTQYLQAMQADMAAVRHNTKNL